MTLTSITDSSSSYPQYSSSTPSSGTQQTSLFAQMLNASGASGSTQGSSQGTAKTSGSNAGQLLTQLVPSFQSTGVQNEAQSLDPMSMF